MILVYQKYCLLYKENTLVSLLIIIKEKKKCIILFTFIGIHEISVYNVDYCMKKTRQKAKNKSSETVFVFWLFITDKKSKRQNKLISPSSQAASWLSRHSSLSSIILGRYSRQHPMFVLNCCRYALLGWPTLVRPCCRIIIVIIISRW